MSNKHQVYLIWNGEGDYVRVDMRDFFYKITTPGGTFCAFPVMEISKDEMPTNDSEGYYMSKDGEHFKSLCHNKTFIIWDNSGTYSEVIPGVDEFVTDGLPFDNVAFPVVEVSIDTVPVDEDGELDWAGYYLCESGKVYKDA